MYLGVNVRHPDVRLNYGQVKYITVATQHLRVRWTKGLYMLCCDLCNLSVLIVASYLRKVCNDFLYQQQILITTVSN
jgi:hypothetical protein